MYFRDPVSGSEDGFDELKKTGSVDMWYILNQLLILRRDMGTVVDITLPTEQFALSETLDRVPDATVKAVPVAAHGPRGVMPFVWGSSSDLSKLEESVRRDETTETVSRLSASANRALYQIQWRSRVRVLIDVFVQANGSLLGAMATGDRWELRILFPERASVSSTCNSWRNHGIDPSVKRVNGVSGMVDCGGIELSECQHKSLVEAFEMNYYDVPRGITLDDLASELDVSHQALSERLRRGHRNLIQTTLCESPTSI